MANGKRAMRVLIVEDETIIAMDIEAQLVRAGCEVVGPAQRVASAMRCVADETFDVALVDVNLGGEKSFGVADALAERRLPFVFLTGYTGDVLPERFRERPVYRKPYAAKPLLAMLARAVRGGGGGGRPPAAERLAG